MRKLQRCVKILSHLQPWAPDVKPTSNSTYTRRAKTPLVLKLLTKLN